MNDYHPKFWQGIWHRIQQEFRYLTCKEWSLSEVGRFWDSVSDYDDINESTYTYFRRFTNSWELAKDVVPFHCIMLDIQARSGKGSEFWYQRGRVKEGAVVDFSDFMLGLSRMRLKKYKNIFQFYKITDYNLPFDDCQFDLICCYETIEHIGHRDLFFDELHRVMKPGGILILTCPNILWEPVHWISAILNIHHSEGPHNFPRRKTLLKIFKSNKMKIIKENTTIILPFNLPYMITINLFLEKVLPSFMLKIFGLRRTFILRK